MAELLKGAPVAAALGEKTAAAVETLRQKGVQPLLAIVRVGAREDDLSYERGAMKRCEKLGIAVRQVVLPEDVQQAALLAQIQALNGDSTVHGVLLFRPLPKHLDEAAVCAALAPEKDVDGITEGSLAGLFMGTGKGFAPCTAAACLEILEYYGIEISGKRATVVGRSLVIGKPAAMLLLARNATVTICHTRTKDLNAACAGAELLVAAAGKAGAVGAGAIAPGQVVLDVGIHAAVDGKLCGDVDFAAAEAVAGAITPVPGGVGAVTTAVLAQHVVQAAARSLGQEKR